MRYGADWSTGEERGATEGKNDNRKGVVRADLRAEAPFEQRDEGEGAELHIRVGESSRTVHTYK